MGYSERGLIMDLNNPKHKELLGKLEHLRRTITIVDELGNATSNTLSDYFKTPFDEAWNEFLEVNDACLELLDFNNALLDTIKGYEGKFEEYEQRLTQLEADG